MSYRRHTAKIEGDFVVFLIGARINTWWMLHKMIPVGRAMQAMVAELEAKPESGFLGHEDWAGRTSIMVQYWRSMAQLMAYARNRDAVHFPAWVHFNKTIAQSGAVGIWHETYAIQAGNYECVYGGMPLFGLGKAAARVEALGALESAQGRLGLTDGSDAAVPRPVD